MMMVSDAQMIALAIRTGAVLGRTSLKRILNRDPPTTVAAWL